MRVLSGAVYMTKSRPGGLGTEPWGMPQRQHNLKIVPKLVATFRSPTASFIRLVSHDLPNFF